MSSVLRYKASIQIYRIKFIKTIGECEEILLPPKQTFNGTPNHHLDKIICLLGIIKTIPTA